MNYKLIYYKDIQKKEWDRYILQMPDAGLYYSWSWLNYISKFSNVKENISFICLAEDKAVLAVCPLAISFSEKRNCFEMSFGGNPCAIPIVADIKPSMRRKLLDEMINIVLSIAQKYNVKKICMLWDPLIQSFCTGLSFHKNIFELLRYQMNYYVENVVVVDLNLPEEAIFDSVSKYQRRLIQRSGKKGVVVKPFNIKANTSEIKNYFPLFQEAHFKSAGRLTRPQETWDAMTDGIFAGDASLFVAFLNNVPISYLYCGEFDGMALGWSQVNVEEYESEYSPRHILEWSAMMFYKAHAFRYYEVGERYYGSQLFHSVTEKEVSISILKERFGGFLLPKIKWTGYFDNKLLADDYNREISFYLSSASVMKIPEY